MLQHEVTWVEDGATVRTGPSDDPGIEAEGGVIFLNRMPPTFSFDLRINVSTCWSSTSMVSNSANAT
ncbi:MAG: hypothetical protein JW829_17520 [Pirellulales bacterium]|nr:hypothetical protein [Pirellulales bacterium]